MGGKVERPHKHLKRPHKHLKRLVGAYGAAVVVVVAVDPYGAVTSTRAGATVRDTRRSEELQERLVAMARAHVAADRGGAA